MGRMNPSEYEEKLLKWHAERENSIRRENGWLALAGLFWLKEGENRLGSRSGSEILLPERLPASVGIIHLDGKQAQLEVEEGVSLKVNGESMTRAALKPDRDGSPSFITLDGLRLVVINRPAGMGVRIWDNLRAERQGHPPRQWYPINEALRLPARYERYAEPRNVLLPDVFGDMLEAGMEGRVSFELNGQTYTLETSEDEGGLEIHFHDLTTGKTTYPSGRYYYTFEPIPEGPFTLDFNYAYNPPCAFTGFATCAFAPAENHLPFAIEAGELFPGY